MQAIFKPSFILAQVFQGTDIGQEQKSCWERLQLFVKGLLNQGLTTLRGHVSTASAWIHQHCETALQIARYINGVVINLNDTCKLGTGFWIWCIPTIDEFIEKTMRVVVKWQWRKDWYLHQNICEPMLFLPSKSYVHLCFHSKKWLKWIWCMIWTGTVFDAFKSWLSCWRDGRIF